MPITGEQFNSGLDNSVGIKGKMYDFLKQNPDRAYTFEEILQATGIAQKAGAKTLIYQLMLEDMVVDNAVEKKIISIHSYYRAV
jgi:histone acetyltransferase (RNA polymerase elongator complex component)